MNDFNKEQKVKIESEIIEIVDKMMKNRIDLIEGCRKITSLQYQLNNPDDVFLFFRGIASETDDICLGEERSTCSIDYLVKLDLEKEEYLTKVKNRILDACKKVKKNLN